MTKIKPRKPNLSLFSKKFLPLRPTRPAIRSESGFFFGKLSKNFSSSKNSWSQSMPTESRLAASRSSSECQITSTVDYGLSNFLNLAECAVEHTHRPHRNSRVLLSDRVSTALCVLHRESSARTALLYMFTYMVHSLSHTLFSRLYHNNRSDGSDCAHFPLALSFLVNALRNRCSGDSLAILL